MKWPKECLFYALCLYEDGIRTVGMPWHRGLRVTCLQVATHFYMRPGTYPDVKIITGDHAGHTPQIQALVRAKRPYLVPVE